MDDSNLKAAVRSRLAGYQALERIEEKELALLSHGEAMTITQRLFAITAVYRDPERSSYSGLVDLQLYLRKLRE